MEPHDKTCTTKTGFECNICFDIPIEPVVSMCGHLYCWSCMYRWIKRQGTSATCPVCKAGVGTDKVISIYTTSKNGQSSRNPNDIDNSSSTERVSIDEDDGEPIPERPSQQRPVPMPTRRSFWRNAIDRDRQALQFAFVSFFPFFSFGFQYRDDQDNAQRREQVDPILLQRERFQIYISMSMVLTGMLIILWVILFS